MKKRLQRIMALLLAGMLIFGGCGKEPEEPVAEAEPEIIVEELEEPEEVIEEPVEEKVPFSVHVDRKNKTYYFEDGENAYLYLRYCDVTVEGDGYEKLKRNIENWSMERSEGLRNLYASFEESAGMEAQESETFDGYTLYQTVSIAKADGVVVSLLEDTYQYEGGAHGTFFRQGINFDSESGKRLKLEDLFYDYAAFVEDAKERIAYELLAEYGEELFEDYIATVEGLWQEDAEPEWYLDASGIVIVLQEYLVGPYSIGTPEIHLPYTEFAPYIKENYLQADAEGVAAFKANQEIFLSLPGIAEEVSMMLVSEQQEDVMSNSLWLDQQELPLNEYLVLEDAYIIKNGKDTYCMIEADMASDDYVTYIFCLTDGVIEKVAEVQAAVDSGNIGIHEIRMESWVYLLGTYGGVKNYHFDEEGNFITEDTEYIFERNEYALTTLVDLPITLEEGESVLPAGSHIILNGTDDETYVKFTIQETGQTGVLKVQRGEEEYRNISINGMNENECFEDLPYAG